FAGTGNFGVDNWIEGDTSVISAAQFDLYWLFGTGAADAGGNLYMVNDGWLIKITPVGALSHVGKLALTALTADRNGELFVERGWRIDRVGPGATLTAVAGIGIAGFRDGCVPEAPGVRQALKAKLGYVHNLATDDAGNVFFTETTYLHEGTGRVRKIGPDGT